MKKIFALAMVLVSMAAVMTSCSNGEADDVMAPRPTEQTSVYSRCIKSNTKNGVTTTTKTESKDGQTTTTQTISTSGTATSTDATIDDIQ